MALFVLLAGFMIGWHYFRAFENDPPRIIHRLYWRRALQIFVIQCIIIATVNAPLHLMGYFADRGESLGRFLFESATLSNQIGIVHILPTFIPLFVVSPAHSVPAQVRTQVAARRRQCHPIYCRQFLAASLGLWRAGDIPYFWRFRSISSSAACGEKPSSDPRNTRPSRSERMARRQFYGAYRLRCTYGEEVLPGHLYSFHPLNIFGLLYQAPIIASVVIATIVFWRHIRGSLFYRWIALLGRNALFAFRSASLFREGSRRHEFLLGGAFLVELYVRNSQCRAVRPHPAPI